MRRLISACLLSLFVASLACQSARADGAVFPDDLTLDYLGVRYHHVAVTIDEAHAVTRVEQEFYNPFNLDIAGQYLFPVFPGSELTRFQVVLDSVDQPAIRQAAATTNAFLYSAVTGRRDPSLLQYVDWETLAFELTVPAGGSRRMVLEYEEVLPPSGGMYRYHYVLSTERYTSRPLDEASLTADVSLSAGLAGVYSPSHAVTVERLNANRAQVSWTARNVQPAEDFDLFFAPTESGFGGGLLTGERAGQGHFMFLFSPQAQSSQASFLPKDIVFVIDRSGSMSGEKIEQARNALRYFVGRLGATDRFSIVAFDDRSTALADTLLAPSQATLDEARRYVASLTAGSSTDIDSALREGLAILERSERRENAARLIVFLTDGLPTAGLTDDAAIVVNATAHNQPIQARLHAFGVGYDVNTHLLDQLAEDNGGSVTYVQPGEDLEKALTDFYDRVARPVLTDLDIEFEGMTVRDLYPQELPDLFDGSSLILTGRYEPGPAAAVSVRVNGKAGDERREFVYHFDLPGTGDYDFVPRLWATRRVGELLDQVRLHGQLPERVAGIRELGLSYGVITPYTSFVIAAQMDGAASSSNMALYDDAAALGQSSGLVTIQARIQNQAYQSAAQAGLAAGANVYNQNHHSLAQLNGTGADALNVDLSLFQAWDAARQPITVEAIEQHVGIDREVKFGSDEYFQLAADPDLRAFLQSGANVIFMTGDEVIRVYADPAEAYDAPGIAPGGRGRINSPISAPRSAQTLDKPWWANVPWQGLAVAFLAGLWLAHLPLLAKLARRDRP